MGLPRHVNTAKLLAHQTIADNDPMSEDAIVAALDAAIMAKEVANYERSHNDTWLIEGDGYEYLFSHRQAYAFILGLQTAFRANR